MPSSDAVRELGESRLHVLAGAGRIWRSPLFVFENHGLLFFQTWDYSRPRPVTEHPPKSRRFVDEVAQQVNGEWQPLHITGAGGGGGDTRIVHWIELELPNTGVAAIRISYSDPALTSIDDQFAVGP